MEKVTLTEPVTFGAGIVLGLTEGQAIPRLLKLEEVESGFRTLDEVHFKAGEVVEVDLEQLPRSIQVHLEARGREERARKKAKKAEGDGQ